MKHVPPGYPLPPGGLGGDDIVCQLVYLPDRAEYWQALYMAISYLATWKAWERDDDKRGRDAAADWRTGLELTTECWRMSCLTDITDRMDIMIDLLGNQMSCCGTTTIGPIITVVTNIEPGVGDDPTEWGETEVSDWEEWNEYICYHAHVYVDSLINGAKAIDLAIELGSYTIDFFVGVMNFMQYLGLDQVLGLNQVMMVYDAFRAENDLSGWFTPLSDKFEAAREDIVCAIVQGGSLQDAVEDAIDDNAVWILFYLFTDYDAVQALIYEGTVDGTEYLAPTKREDCDTCGYDQLFSEDVFVEQYYGDSWGYDSETGEWSAEGEAVSGCRQVRFYTWTDSGKTVRKACKVKVTSCDAVTPCSTLYTDEGLLLDPLEVQYEYDHPPLAGLTLPAVEYYRHLHEFGSPYTITFKLYE